jgi:hypothetical protein
MYPIGQLFYRILVTVVLVFMVAVVAVPINGAAAQGSAPASDDFNRCSPNTSIWQFENPANISGASPVISGQFTGDSLLRMTVPAGQTITFSGRGQNAPRIMQAVADQDFEVEARFAAPIVSTTEAYKIMGILVRDATNASQPKFMRFDFNSKNSALYSYLGYINAAGGLTHIENVKGLTGTSPAAGPLTIRVKYERASGTWTITYIVGSSGSITSTKTFQESTYDPNFTVTHIGLFVGSTGGDTSGTPPGHTMQVDYFKNNASAFVDDGVVLTVETAGSGSGTVNWPMTNPNQCTGARTVSLTASPGLGSSFAGWSVDASGSQTTTSVEMTASKRVVATFNGGLPVDLPFKIFLPSIAR